MASAVDSGRARHLLQQAQGLAAELRSLPMDPETTRNSFSRMFDLARLVRRFIAAAASMPPDDTRAMWEQRGQWLQEEVAALAEERIHSSDQKQYALNLVLLLFAGADMCEHTAREKAEVDAVRDQQAQLIEQQDSMLREAALRIRDAAAAQQAVAASGVAEEVLALHTQVQVLEQELRNRGEDAQRMMAEMQHVIAERDAARQQAEDLRQEAAKLQDRSDAQVEVIQQMMSKNEASSSRSEAIIQDNLKLLEDNKALGASFDTNAKVIEKLIELNSELMDVMNSAATAKQQAAKPPGLEAVAGTASHAPFAAHTQSPCLPPSRLNGHSAGGAPPPSQPALLPAYQQQQGARPATGDMSASAAGRALPTRTTAHGVLRDGSNKAADAYTLSQAPSRYGKAGLTGLPSANGPQAGGTGTPRVSDNTSQQPNNVPSFSDAFEAFIKAPDARALNMAPPAQCPTDSGMPSAALLQGALNANGGAGASQEGQGSPVHRGRRGGLLSGAAGVMRFIAGSDATAATAAAGGQKNTAGLPGGAKQGSAAEPEAG